MKKIYYLMLGSFLFASNLNAATVYLLCPDGSKMQQSQQCAPDAGCWPAGVRVNVDGKSFAADIEANGSITIDDKYLNKTIKVKSQDNFWSPRYCTKLGAGFLLNTFNLKESQTVTMSFQGR